MTDVFFSYSSKDRELVRPIRDALSRLGFDVFWDQAVPAGADWDTWIRANLGKATCAVVLWSANSVASDNVRHEATVAKDQEKLVPVLLEPIASGQFPIGLYYRQAANLAQWRGDERHPEWVKLQSEIEAKLRAQVPLWQQRTLHTVDAELMAERARVKAAETRAIALQLKIEQGQNAIIDAERERDHAIEARTVLEKKLSLATQAILALEATVADLKRQGRDIKNHASKAPLQLRKGFRTVPSVVLLAIIVGIVFSALGITPFNLIERLQHLVRNISNMSYDAVNWAFQYFLMGAVVVVPGWLVIWLVRRNRTH
jgi:hypothetical protein